MAVGSGSDIPNLPRKGSKYWTDVDADVQLHDMNLSGRCEHVFAKVGANTVECNKCNIGFFTTDEVIKDGHIYKDGKLLI